MRRWLYCLVAVVMVVLSNIGQADEPQRAATRSRLLQKLSEKRQQTAAANQSLSLQHAGQTRTYRLHVPPQAAMKKPRPLVIVLHGFGADGGMTEAMSGFNSVADKQNFLVAYPDGIGRMWRFWEDFNTPVAPTSTDDVGFIAALIDRIVQDQQADSRRVYVAGISNGGFMANRLALSLPNKIAAVAPVAGLLPKILSDNARNVTPVPTLIFHGTDDKIVKPDGTEAITKLGLSLSVKEFAEWRARHNGCILRPTQERLPDVAKDGTQVVRHSYCTAKGEVLVEHYEIEGGGHTWPGGSFQPEFLLGKTSKDINASEIMWQFFERHSLKD